jgi:Amt family ammonium transporter|tara:strand:- start:520 stop:696 length:177 start_codon:yes stop_codon:yes gene_type:complete
MTTRKPALSCGAGGIIGTRLAGVFASPDLGPFSGQGFADGIASQAGIQALGVVTVFVY